VAETELDRLAKQLGSRREDVRRLLDMAARSADGARIARNLLRAKLRQAGMDTDDPSAFPLVDQLPPGSIRIGRVLNGDSEGPVLALPQGTAADVQHIGVFGPTRWGKTFILLHVSRQSMDLGGPCWIFDLEDEYARLAAAVVPERKPLILSLADLRMNLLQSPADAIHWQTWLDDLCLLLRQETFLRDGSLNLFNTEMRNLIASKVTQAGALAYPSLVEVRDRIAGLKFGGGKIRSATWLESIVNRLTMLCNTFEETAHVTRSDMLPRLAERSVIFRLRGLRGIPLQFLADEGGHRKDGRTPFALRSTSGPGYARGEDGTGVHVAGNLLGHTEVVRGKGAAVGNEGPGLIPGLAGKRNPPPVAAVVDEDTTGNLVLASHWPSSIRRQRDHRAGVQRLKRETENSGGA
jgi:hypothetical protein